MGIGLGEAAYGWIVVAGAEVVCSGFYSPVLTTVAEGVLVCLVRVAFIAVGVVGVSGGTVASVGRGGSVQSGIRTARCFI